MHRFRLVGSGSRGSWQSELAGENLGLVVAGNDESPDAALVATVEALTGTWPEVRSAIHAFVRALAPDARVPLEPNDDWCFRASDCGFDGELRFQAIAATEREAPTRASVTFYTGLPDGYATYRVVLEQGRPVSISAFAS